jgi:OOP family OmpA-OmpF porin
MYICASRAATIEIMKGIFTMKRLIGCGLVFGCAVVALYAQDFKAYQNYDFVPGDKIIFEDDFRADTDGEFAAHWKLMGGQAVVNKFQNDPAFMLTEGNYVKVEPRIKTPAYLSDPFTVEFDFFAKSGGDAFRHFMVFLRNGDDERGVTFGSETSTNGLDHDLSGHYPGDEVQFIDKWHHAALVYKNNQLKCYLDQYRVLVVPDLGFVATSVAFGGIANPEDPLIFKNVRVATGGGMNLIDKLTKDGRLVTHGILFDVNQATLKPPSMGTISQIVTLLKDNPALKLEIGGHTDTDGDAAKNLTLSQARADAVKKALVDAGIDAARLTSKGYGATKPMDVNTTPEGKANNRRVEFTKIG